MDEAKEVSNTFELLEDNTYQFVIKDLPKVSQTSTEKTRYTINPAVEVGPRANARIFHDFIISPESPKAMAFFFRDMQALGLDAAFFATNPSDETILRALVGRRFTADAYKETYNGKEKNRLRNIRAAVGTAPTGPASPSIAGPAPIAAGGGIPTPQAAPAPAVAPAPVAPVGPQVVAGPPVAAAPPVVEQAPVASPSPWASAPPAPPTF
jgi:hypothetical protein